jgi:hypothetical protein
MRSLFNEYGGSGELGLITCRAIPGLQKLGIGGTHLLRMTGKSREKRHGLPDV